MDAAAAAGEPPMDAAAGGQACQAGGPPQAEMAMVIGKFRVPIITTTLVLADGSFSTHSMIELSQSRKRSNYIGEWLWKALGVDINSQRASETWHLPLLAEIRNAIHGKRGKRSLDGKFRDATGNMLPSLLETCVRGRSLLVENDLTVLRVNLADSVELMNWFLAALWADVHMRPRQLQEGGAPLGAPGKGGGKRGQPALGDTAQAAVSAALESIKLHERVKGVAFDRGNGRFKVMAHGSGTAIYFNVKSFKKHLGDANLSSRDWDGIMNDVVDRAIVTLNDEEEHPQPLEDAPDAGPAREEAPGGLENQDRPAADHDAPGHGPAEGDQPADNEAPGAPGALEDQA